MNSSGPTPAVLLGASRHVIQRQESAWGASWPRAAAQFARQALEDGVAQLWIGAAAGLVEANFTAQLICLRSYLGDEDLARRAHLTWCALSQACHAHPYELAPTIAELQRWSATIDELLTTIANRRQSDPGSGLAPEHSQPN